MPSFISCFATFYCIDPYFIFKLTIFLKSYTVHRIARIALQKRYQDRVNQCVAELPAQDSSYVSPAIPTVIAQMLGLKVDLTSATLSGA